MKKRHDFEQLTRLMEKNLNKSVEIRFEKPKRTGMDAAYLIGDLK